MIRIAVIDSGIDKNHRKLKKCKISGVSIKIEQNGKIIKDNDFSDQHGHGTACAYIISKIAPEVELVAVKIFHNNLLTREDTFTEAIDWCINQEDIKLINISLGISNSLPHGDLTSICEKASKAGKIIVAASHNDINTKSYPASYPWVFSVLSGNIKKSTEYGYLNGNDDEFIAKGSIQRVAWIDNHDRIVTGTSFAAPHITGIIGKLLSKNQHLTFSEIKEKLIENANPSIKPIQFAGRGSSLITPTIVKLSDVEQIKELVDKDRLSWIKNIAIFPTSEKEMKQFLDFPKQCICNIKHLIDYPKTFNTFKTKLSSENEFPIVKQRTLTDEEFDQVDTFVLGYYYDNLWEGNIHFGNKLLEKAIEKGKNFYVYDSRIYKYLKEKITHKNPNQKIYIPKITEQIYTKIMNFQYLPPVNSPILSVIGTGNRQGKFTTQLRLKSILQEEGYKVSHIATEPQGELFGADFSYPNGYMSTVNLRSKDQVLLLRNIVKILNKYNKPDIILTGTQGGFLPRNPLHSIPYLGAAESLAFLYGMLPDIIVCAINPEDPVELIENTVKVAQVYTECHIAFYVLTPRVRESQVNDFETDKQNFLTREAFEERRLFFEKKLKKPVFNIMEDSFNNNIIKLIEDVCS